MHRYLAATTLATLVVAQVVILSVPGVTATGTYEQQVADLVNQERTNRGLPPLVIHYMLENAAEAHSKDMGDHNFCGHGSSDGTSWNTRIQQHGYTPYYGLAENVACGYMTPEQVVNAWMSSGGHRANILGDYGHIGVGYYEAKSAGYGYYWTMDFGKPAPDTPPPQPSPTPCSLEHDFDGSGIIDAGDVEMVTQHWSDTQLYDSTFDVSHDQTINVVDLMIVSSEWGMTCS